MGIPDGELYRNLFDAFPNAEEVFDTLRRNLGKRGYAQLHAIVDLTKEGIEAVYDGDDFKVAEVDAEIEKRWEDFLAGRLPEHLTGSMDVNFDDDLPGFSREQFIHNIAQEIVEFKIVARTWALVIGKETDVPSIPSPAACSVPIQSWFKGLLDAISELGKLKDRVSENPELGEDERIQLYKRFLSVVRQLARRAVEVSHTPGGIINNSTRRGEGFHKDLGRIRRMIGAISVQYIGMLDRKASNDALLRQMKELLGK